MGAGSTSLIVFHEGAVAHTAVIPIGGDHFTSDLSVGLCTPVARGGTNQESLWQRDCHADSGRQRGGSSFGRRPAFAADFAAHGGRNSGAAGPRAVRDDARQSAARGHARSVRRRSCAERRSFALAGNPGYCGIGFAAAQCGCRGRCRWRRCLRCWPSQSLRRCWAWRCMAIARAWRAGQQEDRWGSRLKAVLIGKGA